MKMNLPNLSKTTSLVLFLAIASFSSCKKETSPSTGWNYNDPSMGGFEVVSYQEQETGPGLVFIEGGTFVMGNSQDDVMFEWNNIRRRVTVSSFYMDETEVRNLDYVEYLYWTKRVFGETYPEVYIDALPDTLVWRDPLAYNEPFVDNYLRHPAYRDYPVVGVSWIQASNYASWRTDRVNEMILIREKILEWDPEQRNENNFSTEAYLAGLYDGIVRNNLRDLDPRGSGERRVGRQDGLLLPAYRLPTEAEWEFAALGLIGNTVEERITQGRMYPWAGSTIRSSEKKSRGTFMANVQRGRGDMMGVAGNLNDGGEITVPVYSYWPNDYGLYNMAGNVNEWVGDVYRPLSHEDVADFRPFRGNVFQTLALDENGNPQKDEFGKLIYRNVTLEENQTRRNYRRADNIAYKDGDLMSSLGDQQAQLPGMHQADADSLLVETDYTGDMYLYGETTLISNESRVYKGGSWKDRIHWINPGTRRYLNQYEATNDIGFRCAMTRVGSPIGY